MTTGLLGSSGDPCLSRTDLNLESMMSNKVEGGPSEVVHDLQGRDYNTTLCQPPLTGFMRIARRLRIAVSGHTDGDGLRRSVTGFSYQLGG